MAVGKYVAALLLLSFTNAEPPTGYNYPKPAHKSVSDVIDSVSHNDASAVTFQQTFHQVSQPVQTAQVYQSSQEYVAPAPVQTAQVYQSSQEYVAPAPVQTFHQTPTFHSSQGFESTNTNTQSHQSFEQPQSFRQAEFHKTTEVKSAGPSSVDIYEISAVPLVYYKAYESPDTNAYQGSKVSQASFKQTHQSQNSIQDFKPFHSSSFQTASQPIQTSNFVFDSPKSSITSYQPTVQNIDVRGFTQPATVSYQAPQHITTFQAPQQTIFTQQVPQVTHTSFQNSQPAHISYEAPQHISFNAPQPAHVAYQAPLVTQSSFQSSQPAQVSYQAPAAMITSYQAPLQSYTSHQNSAPSQLIFEQPQYNEVSFQGQQQNYRTHQVSQPASIQITEFQEQPAAVAYNVQSQHPTNFGSSSGFDSSLSQAIGSILQSESSFSKGSLVSSTQSKPVIPATSYGVPI